MITAKEKLLFLALCAYTYDSICDINLSNIITTGLGKDSIREITRSLEVEGYLKDEHVNGCFPRYRMFKEEPCPDFIFDTTLSLGNKETLIKAMYKLKSYEKRPMKQLSMDIWGVEDKTKVLYKVKEYSGKTIFEHLQNIKFIKCKPYHDKYNLIVTKNGMQTASSFSQTEIYIEKQLDKGVIKTFNSAPHLLLRRTLRNKPENNDLTVEEIEEQLEKQDYKDYYTGIPFRTLEEMSIDRIDSSKPYTKSNIVITTVRHNIMKTTLSIPEFKEHITLLYNNLNNF